VKGPQLKIIIKMKDYKNTPKHEESTLEAVAAFVCFIASMVALYVVLMVIAHGG